MVINHVVDGLAIHIDTKRLEQDIRKAHEKLNMQIVADCTPFIPFQQGQLRSQVRYPDGLDGDEIEWYAPYAHYQYEGELYLAENGSSFAAYGEEKFPAGVPLKYHTAGTGNHWFESAKSKNLNNWIDMVKKEVGKDA